MRVIRAVMIAAALIPILCGVALGWVWLRTAPEGFASGSESAVRSARGPYSVSTAELEWTDVSRPTAKNGEFEGSPERRFNVTLWFPEVDSGRVDGGAIDGGGIDSGRQPLVVYSHGFVSSRRGGRYLAEYLASHGYVVVAADFPLTHARAPGGPLAGDVVNQPADVSFLIDQTLAWNDEDRAFNGEIDAERIGVFGLSLGGLTTTLVAFHPELRDARVSAAISLAGPADIFGPAFFDHARVPFLMIAGTSDAIVDYELNALPVPARVRDGGLLTIAGGTHIGFDHISGGLMRVLGNPDGVACRAAPEDSGGSELADNIFVGMFGSTELGLLVPTEYRPGCSRRFENAIAAGRQQMVTRLAVHAFFESLFAADPAVRRAHEAFLSQTLPAEAPEVTFAPSLR